ncbi:hypothetical protein [Paenibacillus sp. MMO-58]|uniref:hypothetical protein n=1 Tax=Paenibacillus sp. MMO-58 TaxID=3081290 RepID=UPI0030169A9A
MSTMRKFERMAIRRERNFLQKKSSFRTGSGALNKLIAHDERRVYFQAAAGKMVNTIDRVKLRAALRDLFVNRTATRKNLERYSNYNSALLGLLSAILREMTKVTTGRKGLRITLIGVRFYLSGCDKAVKDLEVAKANGAEFVLMSYWWLKGKKEPFAHVKRLGLKVLLDSGAFTAFNKGEQLDVVEYGAFVLEHKEVIHAYITLDVIGDAAASAANDEYLRNLGLSPVPVFPAFGELADLERLVAEDHDFICIGGTAIRGINEETKRAAFQKIFTAFPDQNFHWLGGSSSIIVEFPWFSADSSTWLSGRKYGKLMSATFKTAKAPAGMDGFAALAHNVRILAALEDIRIEEVESYYEIELAA